VQKNSLPIPDMIALGFGQKEKCIAKTSLDILFRQRAFQKNQKINHLSHGNQNFILLQT